MKFINCQEVQTTKMSFGTKEYTMFDMLGDYINVSSGKLSVTPDQVKFLITGLMPIPCGFLIRAIPSAQGRLIAMVTLGLSFQYFFYNLCSLPTNL